jgi:hypothetical protein
LVVYLYFLKGAIGFSIGNKIGFSVEDAPILSKDGELSICNLNFGKFHPMAKERFLIGTVHRVYPVFCPNTSEISL